VAHRAFQEFARRQGELLDGCRKARTKEEADAFRKAQQQLLKEWNGAYSKGLAR
jgi:hypothetical protein